MNCSARTIFLGGLLMCLVRPVPAQTVSGGTPAVADTIVKVAQRFKTLTSQYPQEKIYLHHDKPFYAAGDDIWFRAYLVNATTHVPNRLSRLLYVELLNQQDTILIKEKIVKQKEEEFYGDIHLPDTLRPGFYRLRAYTNFMRNAGDDFFFNERIYIGNARTWQLMSKASWKTDGRNAVATITFLNLDGTPLTNTEVAYSLALKNKTSKKQKTNANGEISIGFKLSDLGDRNTLSVSTRSNGVAYNRSLTIPSLSDDIDLQFFPEGGAFLQGKNTAMAFKALNADGLGQAVQGMIYDRNGNEMIEFTSNELGMGRFNITGEAGMTYYAEIQTGEIKKRIDLPAVQTSGITLNLGQSASRVTLMIQATDDIRDSGETWLLLLHSRGALLNAMMMDKSHLGIAMPIDKAQLPSGILTFTLFGKNGPLSERMIFIDNALDQLKIKIEPGRQNYEAHDRVTMILNVTDAKGNPVRTCLSLAVTDDATVPAHEMQSTIFSNLLLSSDLKGHIETPHYYFNDSTGVRTADLDVLMLTQGWSRFRTEDVLHGVFPDLVHPLELSSTISGTVRGLTGIARNASMTLLPSNDIEHMQLAVSDEKGHFEFSGFEYPDSTRYVIQARSQGGGDNMFIFLDSDFVPVRSFKPAVRDMDAKPEVERYLERSRTRFLYDSEARMLAIEDIEVTAPMVIPKTGDAVIDMVTAGMTRQSSYYWDVDKLSAYGGYTFWELLDLCALSFVSEQDRKIEIRSGLSNPVILVDGFSRDLDYVESFVRPEEIDRMIIIRDGNEAAFWGSYAQKNGVIYISMRRGEANQAPDAPGVFIVSPLGYYKAREFYVPNYTADKSSEEPDLRSTIFWDPVVRTDLTGTAIVAFNAADAATTYTVVAEGVSSDGRIGRSTAVIHREQ